MGLFLNYRRPRTETHKPTPVFARYSYFPFFHARCFCRGGARRSCTAGKQVANRLTRGQPVRTAGDVLNLGGRVDAEAPENGGGQVRGAHRFRSGVGRDPSPRTNCSSSSPLFIPEVLRLRAWWR